MPEKKKKKTNGGAGGRPTKYKVEYDDLARGIFELGATEEEAAKILKVSVPTFEEWKKRHPKFLKAIIEGKDSFDVRMVEGALKHRALGYTHDEEKVFCAHGEITTHTVKKHYPPDTAAALFWLRNRDRDRWKDKQEIDHTSSDGSMSPQGMSDEELQERLKDLGIES